MNKIDKDISFIGDLVYEIEHTLKQAKRMINTIQSKELRMLVGDELDNMIDTCNNICSIQSSDFYDDDDNNDNYEENDEYVSDNDHNYEEDEIEDDISDEKHDNESYDEDY